MRAWLTFFADLLFPPRCVGCGRAKEFLCLTCEDLLRRASLPPEPNVVALYDYSDRRVRRAIWYLKYRGVHSLAERLTGNLYAVLIEYLAEIDSYYPHAEPWVLIPVPLHPKRLAERGYNQAALIARALAARQPESFDLRERAVRKVRATKSQVSQASREARAANLKNAFELTAPAELVGRRVILVDDVYTTGSTLRELAKTIRAAGAARIVKVALAQG